MLKSLFQHLYPWRDFESSSNSFWKIPPCNNSNAEFYEKQHCPRPFGGGILKFQEINFSVILFVLLSKEGSYEYLDFFETRNEA